jgi:hypothetical protein
MDMKRIGERINDWMLELPEWANLLVGIAAVALFVILSPLVVLILLGLAASGFIESITDQRGH